MSLDRGRESGRLVWHGLRLCCSNAKNAYDAAKTVNHRNKTAAEQRTAVNKVARWQNLIPSFPWIAPGVGAQSKERNVSNFAA